MKYKITRIEDNKTWEVTHYKFVVFKNDCGKELITSPEIGTALILPPFSPSYLWLTSPIVEIFDEHHFKTTNSTYKIEGI